VDGRTWVGGVIHIHNGLTDYGSDQEKEGFQLQVIVPGIRG